MKRQQKRERDRRYYYRHRARRIAQAKAWNQAHPERRRLISKRWDQRHPDQAKARRQRRDARLNAAPGSHTEAEWYAVLLAHGHCCAYCGQALGERAYKDHVIPISKGGSNGIENILPACLGCNSSKRDRDVDAFLTERGLCPCE